MGADTIKINQSVQLEGSTLKKSGKIRKNDEGMFEEFISSLLQKIRITSNNQDDDNSLPENVLDELLQGMASTNLQPEGLSDFIFSKGVTEEKKPVNISYFTENMLSLVDDAEILDNEGSIIINEGSLTINEGPVIDNLSEFALKVSEYLQPKNSDEEVQSLPDSMYHATNENDIEAVKSILKKYGVIEDDTENIETEGRELGQTENKAPNHKRTDDTDIMSPLKDKKSISNEKSNVSSEQKQLNDVVPAKLKDSTEEKSPVMFTIQEKNSGAADLSGQILSPTEAPDVPPNTLNLSQENIDKIVKSFKTLRLPDSTEISVKLTPEELGEVNVRVVLEKGHVTGHITAESREVALMLENKLDLLKQEMAYKNVNLSDISVSVFTGQGDGSSRNSSRDFLKKNGGRAQNHLSYVEETDIINGDEHDTGLNIIA